MTGTQSEVNEETTTYSEMPRDDMGGAAMGSGMNEKECEGISDRPMGSH